MGRNRKPCAIPPATAVVTLFAVTQFVFAENTGWFERLLAAAGLFVIAAIIWLIGRAYVLAGT